MARINIEETIHKDARFDDLKIKLGGRLQAMGAMIYAWMLAQKWYLTPERLIPADEWENQRIPDEIIEVGLAERVGDKIRMRGVDAQFAWLLDAQTKGKKSGEARRAKSLGNSVNSGSTQLNPVEPPSLSLSPSLSPSLSLAQTLAPKQNLATKNERGNYNVYDGQKRKPPVAPVWSAYSAAYKSRYGADPVRNAKVNGQLAQLVKRLGQEEAPLVAEFFLTHNAAFYTRALHPVGMLLADCEKLRTEWATGKKMTSAAANQSDRKQNNANVYREVVADLVGKSDGKN